MLSCRTVSRPSTRWRRTCRRWSTRMALWCTRGARSYVVIYYLDISSSSVHRYPYLRAVGGRALLASESVATAYGTAQCDSLFMIRPYLAFAFAFIGHAPSDEKPLDATAPSVCPRPLCKGRPLSRDTADRNRISHGLAGFTALSGVRAYLCCSHCSSDTLRLLPRV